MTSFIPPFLQNTTAKNLVNHNQSPQHDSKLEHDKSNVHLTSERPPPSNIQDYTQTQPEESFFSLSLSPMLILFSLLILIFLFLFVLCTLVCGFLFEYGTISSKSPSKIAHDNTHALQELLDSSSSHSQSEPHTTAYVLTPLAIVILFQGHRTRLFQTFSQ